MLRIFRSVINRCFKYVAAACLSYGHSCWGGKLLNVINYQTK